MNGAIPPLVLPSNKQLVYTVRAGDNLSTLVARFYGIHAFGSARYQVAIQHLLYLNPLIKNPNQIRIGQSLLVTPLPSEQQVAQICKAPQEYYQQQSPPPSLPATATQLGVSAEQD